MKNIVVNKLIISFMCCSLLFVGCGKEEEPEVHTISEMSEDTKDEDDTWYKMEDGSFMVVPNMFIQDYEDVKISKKYTVAEKGQLITCLSMIDSFWNGKTDNSIGWAGGRRRNGSVPLPFFTTLQGA